MPRHDRHWASLTASVFLVLVSLMLVLTCGDELALPYHLARCLDTNVPAELAEGNSLLHAAGKTDHPDLRHLTRTVPWGLSTALPTRFWVFPYAFSAKPDSASPNLAPDFLPVLRQ